jgi:hypothetical protein
MNVAGLIASLQEFDPNLPVVFRTLDGDFTFHSGKPFVEQVPMEVDPLTAPDEVEALVLCSDEPGD